MKVGYTVSGYKIAEDTGVMDGVSFTYTSVWGMMPVCQSLGGMKVGLLPLRRFSPSNPLAICLIFSSQGMETPEAFNHLFEPLARVFAGLMCEVIKYSPKKGRRLLLAHYFSDVLHLYASALNGYGTCCLGRSAGLGDVHKLGIVIG
ncbi:hypothetical protein EMCRGX_G005641 [Ephydatia muelleri]